MLFIYFIFELNQAYSYMRFSPKLLFFVLFVFSGLGVVAQSELPSGYYVVVAAYDDTRESFAKKYAEQLNAKGRNVQYGFNSEKNLFYVYVNYFTSLKPSLVDMRQVRQKGEFIDAWVRVVHGVIEEKASPAETKTEPVPATPVVAAKPNQPEPVKSDPPRPVVEEKKPIETPAVVAAPVVETPAVDEPIEEGEKIIQHKKMTLGNTEVFLSLFYGTKNRVVQGEVQVIDTDRSRFVAKAKGNDYVILPDPKSKSGQLTLTCEVFGYRKIQHEINYLSPLSDTTKEYVELMGTTIVVDFDLVRLQKGDINTLYNVYFYNDAAVMLPESKYELNSLLEMMTDNPSTKIVLHGHSNGNYHGKILGLGPDKNFFTMEGAVQGMGTAKDLSQQRAETIKEYLLMSGIASDRIEVKAWGGKKPLYDKHSVNAKKNVRVEVEVVQ
jgi:outer membrane protein OmpA-like peptidoglycan-associated protein